MAGSRWTVADSTGRDMVVEWVNVGSDVCLCLWSVVEGAAGGKPGLRFSVRAMMVCSSLARIWLAES